MRSRSALATVTDRRFLPGTLVTLRSFLQVHPAFDGDIVVFHDGLTEAERVPLGAFSRVTLTPISESLRSRLRALGERFPAKAHRLHRFHALEVCRLAQYDKVVFCDSDLLFRASVDELFESDAALTCCGDLSYYLRISLNAETFEPAKPLAPGTIDNPFNSGVMVFDGRALGEVRYQAALNELTADFWDGVRVATDDQVIFNRLFDGEQVIESCMYNYLLQHAAVLKRVTGVRSIGPACCTLMDGRNLGMWGTTWKESSASQSSCSGSGPGSTHGPRPSRGFICDKQSRRSAGDLPGSHS